MEINIRNTYELEELEKNIAGLIQHHDLDEILGGLRQAPEEMGLNRILCK
jgi:hypothetical protein